MIRQRWPIGDWKNRTFLVLKKFKPSLCMPALDGRAQFYPTLKMDDYHQILRKPRRSRNELPSSRCWMTSFTKEASPNLTWDVLKRKKPNMLEEVHGGVCGNHMGAKSLVRKIMRAVYFWPSMQQDTVDFVKRCDSCQRYGNVQRVLGEKMATISSPWPFAQWGIDIRGPLSQGKR